MMEALKFVEEKSKMLQNDAHVAQHGATKHHDVVTLPHGASGAILEEKEAAHGRQRRKKNCDHSHGASCRHHGAHGAQHPHRDVRGELRCYCCGEVGHKKYECVHRHSKCGLCSRVGHTEKTCWRKINKAKKCFCCGKVGHVKKNCPHRGAKYFKCGKTGHLAVRCFQKHQPIENKSIVVEDVKLQETSVEPLVDALNLVIPVIQSALIGLNLDVNVRKSLVRLMDIVVEEMKVKS